MVLLIPIIIALITGSYTIAFYLFIVAGVSDCLDGLLARRFGWTSRYGAIVDPLADKLLLISTFITLGYLGQIPTWLVSIVIGRDVWIITGAFAYHFFVGQLEFNPSQLSKYNTFFQILLVVLTVSNLSVLKISPFLLQRLIELIAVFSLLSFLDYTWIWGYRTWQVKTGRILQP